MTKYIKNILNILFTQYIKRTSLYFFKKNVDLNKYQIELLERKTKELKFKIQLMGLTA